MKNLRTYIDLLNKPHLCQYLRKNDWHPGHDLYEGTVKQFLTPNREDAVLIPLIKDFSDYYNVMENSLNTIAKFENINITNLITQLLNPISDILKWKIANEETITGDIPFSSVLKNIASIKDLLSSSCLDILSPSIFHKKQNIKKVEEQISTYMFGQTEVGSFIINLICPLNLEKYEPPLFEPSIEELPLSRKINIRLINNINTIQTSITDRSSLLKEKIDAQEISVNFLKALKNLYDINKNSEYNINANWNAAVIIPSDIINHVELIPRCIDKVEETIESFSTLNDQNDVLEYVGKIVNINGEPDLDRREDVIVTIATISEKNRLMNIKCQLNNAEYYPIVDDAFKNGLSVKITGTLEQRKKNTFLTDGTIELI